MSEENSKATVIKTLRQSLDVINTQIEDLKGDRDAILRIVKKYENGDVTSVIATHIDLSAKNIMKPTNAIMQMFDENPDKALTPSELRDRLQLLRNERRLESKTNNLLHTVHSTLKLKVKSGIIEKIEDSSREVPVYRRKLKKDTSALFNIDK